MPHRTGPLVAFCVALMILSPLEARQDKKGPDEKIAELRGAVTRLRGLEFSRDVAVGHQTKDEFVRFLERQLEKELPPSKASRLARALAKFGLLPKDYDLRGAYLTLLESAVAAFYDPEAKELKVIQGGGASLLESKLLKLLGIDLDAMVLVHELTHAAQDQAFDLATLPLDDATNDDLGLALRSVVEGDASVVGWKFALGDRFDRAIGAIDSAYKSGQIPGKGGELPAYLRLTLTFPYGHGTDFVVKVLQAKGSGGPAGASALFRDFPLSSEQILHPEKYLERRDPPILVTLPDLAKLFGPSWTKTLENVHGEFGIRILLSQFRGEGLSSKDITAAAEGWGGDRYVVLEDESARPLIAWYTVWDTEEDAREFFAAYRKALERKSGRAAHGAAAGDKTQWETAEGWVSLERRGADVLVLDGAPKSVLEKADAIWKDVGKREMTSFERLKKPAEVERKKKEYSLR